MSCRRNSRSLGGVCDCWLLLNRVCLVTVCCDCCGHYARGVEADEDITKGRDTSGSRFECPSGRGCQHGPSAVVDIQHVHRPYVTRKVRVLAQFRLAFKLSNVSAMATHSRIGVSIKQNTHCSANIPRVQQTDFILDARRMRSSRPLNTRSSYAGSSQGRPRFDVLVRHKQSARLAGVAGRRCSVQPSTPVQTSATQHHEEQLFVPYRQSNASRCVRICRNMAVSDCCQDHSSAATAHCPLLPQAW